MGIREGLSFSDYFDDSVPYEVKPVPSTIPMEELLHPLKNYGDDYPNRAKDLFKGLWEEFKSESQILHKDSKYWMDENGEFHDTDSEPYADMG